MSADLPSFARDHLRLRDKDADLRPFVLNASQNFIHEQIEAQRAATGRVRAIILKPRQSGMSSYVLGRLYWQLEQRIGVTALTVTHLDTTAAHHIRVMECFRQNATEPMQLTADEMGERWRAVISASQKVRGAAITFLHASEMSYWPNAGERLTELRQQVPDLDGTEIIVESSPNASSADFRNLCREAMARRNEFHLSFAPWFLQGGYRRPVSADFQMTNEERQMAAAQCLDAEQIAWRRMRIDELRDPVAFRRSYPSTIEEALDDQR